MAAALTTPHVVASSQKIASTGLRRSTRAARLLATSTALNRRQPLGLQGRAVSTVQAAVVSRSPADCMWCGPHLPPAGGGWRRRRRRRSKWPKASAAGHWVGGAKSPTRKCPAHLIAISCSLSLQMDDTAQRQQEAEQAQRQEARRLQRAEARKREQATNQVAAIAASLGVTALAGGATYYRCGAKLWLAGAGVRAGCCAVLGPHPPPAGARRLLASHKSRA